MRAPPKTWRRSSRGVRDDECSMVLTAECRRRFNEMDGFIARSESGFHGSEGGAESERAFARKT